MARYAIRISEVIRETEKAWLIDGGAAEMWLPKSKADIYMTTGGPVALIPAWLIKLNSASFYGPKFSYNEASFRADVGYGRVNIVFDYADGLEYTVFDCQLHAKRGTFDTLKQAVAWGRKHIGQDMFYVRDSAALALAR